MVFRSLRTQTGWNPEIRNVNIGSSTASELARRCEVHRLRFEDGSRAALTSCCTRRPRAPGRCQTNWHRSRARARTRWSHRPSSAPTPWRPDPSPPTLTAAPPASPRADSTSSRWRQLVLLESVRWPPAEG